MISCLLGLLILSLSKRGEEEELANVFKFLEVIWKNMQLINQK